MTEPLFLTLDEALQIHAYQVETFGGSDVVLDMSKLESALAQPRQGFGGQYLHEDMAAMAAAYLFHIVKNHPFEDGNKRTGAQAAIAFLNLNDIEFPFSEDELIKITMAVADKQGTMTKAELTEEFRHRLNEEG